MPDADVLALIVAIALVPLGGWFACVDSALAAVSVARVDEAVREQRRGAKALQAVLADRARYTNLLLLLRVICELGATVLATVAAHAAFGGGWQIPALTIVVMVVISYAVVGVGPRTLGRQHPHPVALACAGPVRVLGRLFGPLAFLLTLFGNAITPGKGFRDGPFASEVELRELVDMATQSGVVESSEREMIQSVFELGDTIAREVMVPRTEVVWISADKTVRQGLALALRSGFSRIPVMGENADDIRGIVYLKDLARRAQEAEAAVKTPVEALMRRAEFVPESKPVDELLREMQSHRTHMAIVIDEYGGTAGLVTIEDILEEIVGEITDEYDVERPPVEHLGDDTVRVSGRLAVEDLAGLFELELPERDDVETVAGLMADLLGRVPIPGAQVDGFGLSFTAEAVGGRRNRIDTVLVSRAVEHDDLPADQPGQAEQPPGEPGSAQPRSAQPGDTDSGPVSSHKNAQKNAPEERPEGGSER